MSKNPNEENTKINWWIVLGLSILAMTVIIGSFVVANCCLSTKCKPWLDGGAWAGIVLGTLGAIATTILGYVACWQNNSTRKILVMEQHSNIYLQKEFKYKKCKVNDNFWKNTDSNSVNYFVFSLEKEDIKKYKFYERL